ncbi:MAG: hypothetical protein HZB16_09930 [Armatimonadetes bacterium]|nr:hypothetical protein [Armatimonadota bacterium]
MIGQLVWSAAVALALLLSGGAVGRHVEHGDDDGPSADLDTGAVRVVLAPDAAAAAGGRWFLDSSTTPHISGATVDKLAVGTHIVRFRAVAGYTAPADQAVVVREERTTTVTGTYRAATATGSVRVTLAPAAAITAGARWLLDASPTAHASGEAVAGLAAGTHTIKFVAVTGYTSPASQTVTVSANQTTAVTGLYVAIAATTGAVRVTIGPAAAVTAGAKWVLDGSPTLHASGDTVSNLMSSAHTIRFTAVAGYTTPASQTATVAAGATAAVTGTYSVVTASTGSVRVTLSPAAAVTAGAKWLLDAATAQYASGATVANLPAGAHTIRFSAVAGYTTPANQTVTVAAGATTAVTGTYVAVAASTGSIRVTVAPAAATAGARWLLDSSATPHLSGETVASLAVGTHTIRFSAVAGYTTPANQTVTVAAGATTAVTGTYVAVAPSTGSVKVTLAPAAAVTAGAKWLLDASATPHVSGETVASLAVGTHTVSFVAATGYTTPASQTVTVAAGATTAVTGTYTVVTPSAGSVKVTLAPAAAVTAGAKWLLDASTTQYASGVTVAGLAAGTHTVKFVAVAGYATPANATVTVTAGGTASATGTYTALISFATTIRPVAAANCSCHGSTMADYATLISSGRVVKGNTAASSYVSRTSMQSYWGAFRQTVLDWISQGANP